MKKFLTVLLVIAVMFTFSFGSAFAAPASNTLVTESKVNESVLSAANYAKAQEKVAMDTAINALFRNENAKPFGGTTVSKASVTAIFEKEYAKAVAAIDTAYAEKLADIQAAIIADNGTGDAFSGYFTTGTAEDGYPAIASAWTTFPGTTSYGALFAADGTGTKAKDVYAKEFATVKANAIVAIEAIDLTVYSTDAKGAPQSNYDKASALVAKALNELATKNLAATADVDDYKTAIAEVYAIYTPAVNEAAPTGLLYDGGTGYDPGLKNIQKTTAEPTEAAKLEWAQNKVLSYVVGNLNSYRDQAIEAKNNIIIEENLKTKPDQTVINTAKDQIETLKAQYAAAEEIITYLVKDCDDYTKLLNVNPTTFTDSTPNTSVFGLPSTASIRVPAKVVTANYATVTGGVSVYDLATCLAIAKKVDSLEADAELAKKEIELDGTTYADIDKALAKAIDATYYGDATAAVKKASAGTLLYNRQVELIGELDTDTVVVNSKKYDAVEAWDKTLTDTYATYNKDQYDAVRKIMSDTEDAIWDAESIEAADAAFLEGLKALDAVPTKSDQTLAQAKKDFIDLKAKYEAEIDAYATYKFAGYNATENYDYVGATFVGKLKTSLTKAYNVEELTELYNKAIAEIDGLQTEAALKEAKAAIEKQIAAIPTKVTVENKAVVEAAREALDAHNDYCDLIGNITEEVIVTSALTNAETAIKNAEIKAIQDAYAAIMKDGKVTLDEKADVEALRDAFDAFCEYYTPTNAHNGQLVAAAGTVTEGNIDNLEDAIWTAEAKAVEEMIAVLDVVNIDADAVRAARAAYDASVYGIGDAYYDKLVALEKVLAVDVQAVKIKASSTATKGAITVKWTVKGNASAVEGYEIWKSTKKNSGFKKMFTTTKTSYKNTKGLKKGTRYYYKVRAIAYVDGQKVTSDWSNKAYRVAK